MEDMKREKMEGQVSEALMGKAKIILFKLVKEGGGIEKWKGRQEGDTEAEAVKT